MKKFYLVTAVAVVLSLLVAGFVIRDLRSEKRRLGRNVEALLSTAEFYRTRAGESAASVAALHLEIDELKAYRSRDAEQIRSLGIRLRRAESIAHSALESGYEVSLRLRDTIVVRDTLRDTIRLFLHDDRWSHLQQTRFGQLTQPLYVAISPDGQLLAKPMGFTESPQDFADWLRKGLKAYRTSTANNQQP